MADVARVPMKVLPFFGAVALAGLFPGAGAAQEALPPGPVRETAEVALVEVPVRVTDRDGRPLGGLTQEDFTLLDDGRPQQILGFDAIDLAEKVHPGAGEAPPPAARRRFLILFDFSFARPKSVVAARRAAKELVLHGLGENDLAAVATYSVERGVRLLATFSSDRAQVARAIETLGLEAPTELRDPLAFAFDTTALRGGAGPNASSERGGSRVGDLIDALQTMSSLHRARADEYARGRVRHLVQSFRDLAQTLAAVEGRKDVIYLSEGFSGRYLVGERESDQESQWLIQGELWKVDADKRFGSSSLRSELGEMGEIFRRSDTVMHAVDIAGIRNENTAETEAIPLDAAQVENSLYEIASGTGGEVFRNANDLGGQLSRLMSQTSVVYVLAFRPNRAGKEGKFHKLQVRVAVAGSRVSARAGYYERRGFRHLTPLERSLSAADVIANEIPVRDIRTRVLATPFATSETVAAVPVLLEIPGADFLEGEGGDRTGLEIYVYASDQDNRLADFFVQTVGVDLTKSRERLKAGGFKYYGELALPPGAYRLRALVRNADTGRMGLSVSSLQVPAFSADQPYLLAPMFLAAKGEWLELQGRRSAAGTAGYPILALGNESFAPTALPEVASGTASRVCLVAYHFGPAGGVEALKLGSQILAEDGRPLSEGALSVLAKSTPEADGKRMLLLSFQTPQGLAPGRYGLRIFLQDASTGRARHASAPFLVP